MKRLAVLVTAVASSLAFACSCPLLARVVPEAGSSNVPTNVIGLGVHGGGPEMALTTADGQPVAFTSRNEAGRTVSLVPDAPLKPNTEYVVVEPPSNVARSRFTTGKEPDTTPPAAPVIEAIAWNETSTMSSLALTITDGVLLLVRAAKSGMPVEPTAAATWLSSSATTLRHACCNSNATGPLAADVELTVQAMDLAGNVSAISPPFQREQPQPVPEAPAPPGGCTTSATFAVSWLALVLISRRSRQRAASRPSRSR